MDWTAFGEWTERVGIPAALAIILAVGLIFILNRVFKSDEVKARASSQVDLKEAEGQTALARAIETQAESSRIQAQAFSGLDQTLKDNGQVSAKIVEALGQILSNQSVVEGNINAIENNINTHVDTIIKPYEDIHAGHTEKLLNIQDIQGQILRLVTAIQTNSELYNAEQKKALEKVTTVLEQWVDDTTELDIITLSNDNHKEKTE